jgi:D-specific alpha-keto acid dehydrogenase
MAKTGITIYGCEEDEAFLFQNMAARFNVMPTITASPVSESNVELARGSQCISVNHKTQVTDATLLALSKIGVKYISTRSIGYNHINRDFAKGLGITIGNVAYSPDSVADYTILLMLMTIRDAPSTLDRAAAHDFRLGDKQGKELRDMTIGVVGTGHIGAAVINRLRGFGCRVIAYDHRHKTSADYVLLDELFEKSDIVTLHIPLTSETFHLLNRERIRQMKPDAFVINTSRGSLIDTPALIEALENSKLSGVALDVLEGEEGIFYNDFRNKSIENKPLLSLQKMPNVIITPHTAYYTDHALHDIIEHSITNCLKFIKEKIYE